MLGVRSELVAGGLAHVAALVALAITVGLSGVGWVVGLLCGVVASTVLARGLARNGVSPGPADFVTLARGALTCGVAALVAEAFFQQPAVAPLLVLTVAALVLDAVDGAVARLTRTESTFGARFDGEIDAFLLLCLSVYVAHTISPWVFAIGAARYAFAVAGWVLPWLRGRLPYRYWRKVVTAVQGIVLAVAVADILPLPLITAALAAALALLAESFGRDVLWLWRHRTKAHVGLVASATEQTQGARP